MSQQREESHVSMGLSPMGFSDGHTDHEGDILGITRQMKAILKSVCCLLLLGTCVDKSQVFKCIYLESSQNKKILLQSFSLKYIN